MWRSIEELAAVLAMSVNMGANQEMLPRTHGTRCKRNFVDELGLRGLTKRPNAPRKLNASSPLAAAATQLDAPSHDVVQQTKGKGDARST